MEPLASYFGEDVGKNGIEKKIIKKRVQL